MIEHPFLQQFWVRLVIFPFAAVLAAFTAFMVITVLPAIALDTLGDWIRTLQVGP